VLGSAHGTDILDVYGGTDMTNYLINFAVNLDPNGQSLLHWPQYSVAAPTLLTFLDGLPTDGTEQDTFRANGFEVLTNLSLQFREWHVCTCAMHRLIDVCSDMNSACMTRRCWDAFLICISVFFF
jgi:hypothetical protein